ncbi:MAG: Asp-tRNA(Asn)/Glu-tRNA(Gln) amidotransferase GatCAB subunit B, partial [Pedobacter sp.]
LIGELGISQSDAAVLADDKDLYQYYTEALTKVNHKKSLVNWLLGSVRAILNENQIEISNYAVSPRQLAQTINLVDDKKISQQNAIQTLLPALESSNGASADELAKQLNLLIVEDVDAIDSFINEVLAKYQPQVEAYKKGKKGVLGLFVGEVMKLAKGKADAKKINELILKRLEA